MRPRSTPTLAATLFLALLLGVAPRPATAQADPDEPILPEIPDACSYLTEAAARGFLDVEAVSPSAANEHIPTFWSQCIYGGRGASGGEVGFVFKFMVWDLFDTALDPIQLNFNAQFTGGGVAPSTTLDDPGKVTFTFEDGDRTTVMLVTGIQGPHDNFGIRSRCDLLHRRLRSCASGESRGATRCRAPPRGRMAGRSHGSPVMRQEAALPRRIRL